MTSKKSTIQLENGHVKIANDLLDKFAKVKMSGTCWQILMAIIRKLYGYNKKEDWIEYSQLMTLTGLPKSRISFSIKQLCKCGIVTQKRNGIKQILAINKDFEGFESVTETGNCYANTNNKRHIAIYKPINNIIKPIDNINNINISNVVPELVTDAKKHIQIIGFYALAKKVEFTSKEHQSTFIKRNLRAAQDLTAYDLERIKDVMRYLYQKADFKWTLESVGKYIDEDLGQIEKKKEKKDPVRVLYDGARVIQKFGVWVLERDNSIKVDIRYYPELAKDIDSSRSVVQDSEFEVLPGQI